MALLFLFNPNADQDAIGRVHAAYPADSYIDLAGGTGTILSVNSSSAAAIVDELGHPQSVTDAKIAF